MCLRAATGLAASKDPRQQGTAHQPRIDTRTQRQVQLHSPVLSIVLIQSLATFLLPLLSTSLNYYNLTITITAYSRLLRLGQLLLELHEGVDLGL